MGDLTRNLSASEFYCHCTDHGKTLEQGYCGGAHYPVNPEFYLGIQVVLDEISHEMNEVIKVVITSGHRCDPYNVAVGGVDNSRHTNNSPIMAADLHFYYVSTGNRVDPDLVADVFERRFYTSWGIGRYSNRTHVDSRSKKARWDVRKTK